MMNNYVNEYMNFADYKSKVLSAEGSDLPNFSCARDYGYTGKFLHEMLSRRFHPEGGPINNVIAAEMMLPESGSEHDIVHELMYRIVHEIEKQSDGQKIQGIEVIMQNDPMLFRSRLIVRVGTMKPQWQTVNKIGTVQVPEKVTETPQSAPQLADRILPD